MGSQGNRSRPTARRYKCLRNIVKSYHFIEFYFISLGSRAERTISKLYKILFLSIQVRRGFQLTHTVVRVNIKKKRLFSTLLKRVGSRCVGVDLDLLGFGFGFGEDGDRW